MRVRIIGSIGIGNLKVVLKLFSLLSFQTYLASQDAKIKRSMVERQAEQMQQQTQRNCEIVGNHLKLLKTHFFWLLHKR